MNVIYMNDDGEFPSYSLNGAILEINEKNYDLVSLQADEQSIIDVIKDDRFVANIIIPPAKYEEIESDEEDEEGNKIVKRIKKPLDVESVTLNLWKFEKEIIKEEEL